MVALLILLVVFGACAAPFVFEPVVQVPEIEPVLILDFNDGKTMNISPLEDPGYGRYDWQALIWNALSELEGE